MSAIAASASFSRAPTLAQGQMVRIASGDYEGQMGIILQQKQMRFLVQVLQDRNSAKTNIDADEAIYLWPKDLMPLFLSNPSPDCPATTSRAETPKERDYLRGEAPQESLSLSPSPSNVSSITAPTLTSISVPSHDTQEKMEKKSNNNGNTAATTTTTGTCMNHHKFEAGQAIKIIGGTYKGHRGFVRKQERTNIVIKLEHTDQEIAIMPHNVGPWEERSVVSNVLKQRRQQRQLQDLQQQRNGQVKNILYQMESNDSTENLDDDPVLAQRIMSVDEDNSLFEIGSSVENDDPANHNKVHAPISDDKPETMTSLLMRQSSPKARSKTSGLVEQKKKTSFEEKSVDTTKSSTSSLASQRSVFKKHSEASHNFKHITLNTTASTSSSTNTPVRSKRDPPARNNLKVDCSPPGKKVSNNNIATKRSVRPPQPLQIQSPNSRFVFSDSGGNINNSKSKASSTTNQKNKPADAPSPKQGPKSTSNMAKKAISMSPRSVKAMAIRKASPRAAIAAANIDKKLTSSNLSPQIKESTNNTMVTKQVNKVHTPKTPAGANTPTVLTPKASPRSAAAKSFRAKYTESIKNATNEKSSEAQKYLSPILRRRSKSNPRTQRASAAQKNEEKVEQEKPKMVDTKKQEQPTPPQSPLPSSRRRDRHSLFAYAASVRTKSQELLQKGEDKIEKTDKMKERQSSPANKTKASSEEDIPASPIPQDKTPEPAKISSSWSLSTTSSTEEALHSYGEKSKPTKSSRVETAGADPPSIKEVEVPMSNTETNPENANFQEASTGHDISEEEEEDEDEIIAKYNRIIERRKKREAKQMQKNRGEESAYSTNRQTYSDKHCNQVASGVASIESYVPSSIESGVVNLDPRPCSEGFKKTPTSSLASYALASHESLSEASLGSGSASDESEVTGPHPATSPGENITAPSQSTSDVQDNKNGDNQATSSGNVVETDDKRSLVPASIAASPRDTPEFQHAMRRPPPPPPKTPPPVKSRPKTPKKARRFFGEETDTDDVPKPVAPSPRKKKVVFAGMDDVEPTTTTVSRTPSPKHESVLFATMDVESPEKQSFASRQQSENVSSSKQDHYLVSPTPTIEADSLDESLPPSPPASTPAPLSSKSVSRGESRGVQRKKRRDLFHKSFMEVKSQPWRSTELSPIPNLNRPSEKTVTDALLSSPKLTDMLNRMEQDGSAPNSPLMFITKKSLVAAASSPTARSWDIEQKLAEFRSVLNNLDHHDISNNRGTERFEEEVSSPVTPVVCQQPSHPSHSAEASVVSIASSASSSSSMTKPLKSTSSLGATWQEILQYPSRSVAKHEVMCFSNCFQCSKAFKEKDTFRTLPCQHSFHTRCIDPWLFQQAECPMCKAPIVTLEI